PVSSSVSRSAASRSDSLASRCPAGWLSTMRPALNSSTKRKLPSSSITVATVIWGCQSISVLRRRSMSRIVQGRALLVKVLRYKKRTPTPGRGSLDTQALSGIQCSQSGVEGGAWAHHLAGQLRVGAVVAADVGRLALYGSQFGNDGRFLLGQLLGQRSEVSLQLGIVVLLGQGLCPVQRQVEVAATVVDFTNL